MIRKLRTIGLLLFLTAGQIAFGQATNKELQKVVTGFFDALAEQNIDKLKSFCTDDISLLETGKVWNFDTLALRIQARKSKSANYSRINKLDFIETRVMDDIAWISYFNYATISFNNKVSNVKWLESVVLKREKDKWKISLLHSTELERTP